MEFMIENGRDVAIIGMACVFPGAPDLATYRDNIKRGVDAISEPPPSRWGQVFYDPSSDATDRIYCRRGGFIGDHIVFDPSPYGIMPVAAQGAEPDQLLGLQLVTRALQDAGLDPDRDLPRETTAVILGRGGYPGPRTVAQIQHSRTAQQLVEAVRDLAPQVTQAQLDAVRQEFLTQLGHYGGDTVIGIIPNIAASRIANRFDLHGSAYTVDAACASSLVAVDHGVRQLQSGTADVAITGGIHLCDDLYIWNIFSRLGAMSRSESSRPFDRRADGLLIGEGVGILILKRLADAERDGNRVYAVIRGVGTASDGREKSLMLPSVDGQVLAVERAWKMAGLDPATIGLIEAHGTATPNGDRAELQTIIRCFGGRFPRAPVLGSVKSMIGHAMPASGAAGLIKAALALHDGFLPPTLNCEQPHDLLGETGFRVLAESDDWDPEHLPRRAAVNAFGFGGINAHAVLDGHVGSRAEAFFSPRAQSWPEIYLGAGDTPDALCVSVMAGRSDTRGGRLRVAIENPTPHRRELACKIVRRGKRWGGRNGIWYSPSGLANTGGRIAFLFPGYDGLFDPRVEDVGRHFGRDLPAFHDARDDLVAVSAGIIALGRWLTEVLRDLGVEPDAIAGHSIGEWAGMVVSGVAPEDQAERFIDEMAPSLRVEVPGLVFAAAGCDTRVGIRAIEGLNEIGISHDNCPHQIILCGVESSIQEAISRLREHGFVAEKLPFRSGFHSPLLEPYLSSIDETFRHFKLQPGRVPLWSATTVKPYPSDSEAIRSLCRDHLLKPVRFRELTERLYEEGIRVFVQVGVGRLMGFVEDTLKGRPHVAIAANTEQRQGMEQLRRLATQLWCEGYAVNLEKVGLSIAAAAEAGGEANGLRLSLYQPLVKLNKVFDVAVSVPAVSPLEDLAEPGAVPVMAELAKLHMDLAATSNEVVAFWRRRASDGAARPVVDEPATPAARAKRLVKRRRYSLADMPEVIDHSLGTQPEGWPYLEDRFLVVPMTRSLGTVLDFAAELVPDLVPVAIERVRALRWIEVEPPKELELVAELERSNRVRVDIGGHLSAVVVMAPGYEAAPRPKPFEPGEIEAPSIDIESFYYDPDASNFHGPHYQSVVAVGPIGTRGIRGEIKSLPASGAFLDGATQLLGYWALTHTTEDRVALPFRVDRIEFFGPHPPVGQQMQVDVQITELTDVLVRGDWEVHDGERVWARVSGWEDRRFEEDARLHRVFMVPAKNSYARFAPAGYCVAEGSWRNGASWYFIARRYLGKDEQAEYDGKKGRGQRAWLLGRIAVKDALREWLWAGGSDAVFPVEVRVRNDASGRPVVEGPWDADLRVSLAHKENIAVALIAEGADVGIDVERIEPRGDEVLRLVCSGAETDMLPDGDREEWLTRLWVAKEAVAKAHGTGLNGNARRFALEAVAGSRLLVNGVWVRTVRDGEHIIGWTEHSAIWRPQKTEPEVHSVAEGRKG
ncbi:polyketide synthase family protein [Thioflavicoccus mobilis 8321]|uniref:Polyketide synthase family protein n=2 Tax=Thioflavicoccus mobilis TaxID=80679 RepID=L0GWM2_9GAMM|nr:polyketide synthase family protein [Thioflavicoccus mobilis 8321]